MGEKALSCGRGCDHGPKYLLLGSGIKQQREGWAAFAMDRALGAKVGTEEELLICSPSGTVRSSGSVRGIAEEGLGVPDQRHALVYSRKRVQTLS